MQHLKRIPWKYDEHGQQYLLDLNPLLSGSVYQYKNKLGSLVWYGRVLAANVIDLNQEFETYSKAKMHVLAYIQQLIITANNMVFEEQDLSKSN